MPKVAKSTKVKEKRDIQKRVKNSRGIKRDEKSIEKKAEIKQSKATSQGIRRIADNKPRIVYAYERYIHVSPRKARLVADLIRHKNVLGAIEQLAFVQKKSALLIRKALSSAYANAVNNFEMDKKRLVVADIRIDEAPMLKRGRAGSRGRYKKILRRNCHITIGVMER
jgi:large subunit ribosomal protein L22